MARKRGGLAGVWDRNKGVITPAAEMLAGAINPLLGAGVGAAIGALDRPGKSGIGIDPFHAVTGGIQGYGMGKLGQSARTGLQGLFTGGMEKAVPVQGISGNVDMTARMTPTASMGPSAITGIPSPEMSNLQGLEGGNIAKSLGGGSGMRGLSSGDIAKNLRNSIPTATAGPVTPTPFSNQLNPPSLIGSGIPTATAGPVTPPPFSGQINPPSLIDKAGSKLSSMFTGKNAPIAEMAFKGINSALSPERGISQQQVDLAKQKFEFEKMSYADQQRLLATEQAKKRRLAEYMMGMFSGQLAPQNTLPNITAAAPNPLQGR